MHRYTKRGQVNRHAVCLGVLIIGCAVVAQPLTMTLSAKEDDSSTGDSDPIVRFSDVNAVSGDYSEALRGLCDDAQIGAIHSYRYYKNTGQITGRQEPPETRRAMQLLKGLSAIAWSAMQDEMDSKTRLGNLAQLVRLERQVLEAKPLGAANMELAHDISSLISAIIFQEVADSELENVDRVLPFAHRDTLNTYCTVEALQGVFEREVGYRPVGTPSSQYDLLANVLSDKHPDLSAKLDLDSIAEYALLSHKGEPGKSRNPLIDVDVVNYVSNLLVVRSLELCARFSVPYRKLRETSDDRMKSLLLFNQALISGTTDFDKQIHGANMDRRIRGQIRDNLRTRGKRILELIHRRCLVFSEDSDLPESDK